MKALIAAALLALTAGAAVADDAADKKAAHEQDCRYQADVAAAVQKARLKGVRERKISEAIAKTNPTWPARYNNAIPIFAGEIYQKKRRELRKVDLGEQWMQMCMSAPASE